MTPEPVLLSVGLLLGAAIVWAVEAVDGPRAAVLLGALVGLGTATKVTFAVTGLAAVAVLPGWRARVRFAAAAAVSLALCLLPIGSSLGRLARWLFRMATHSGEYGSGPATVVDWTAWRRGFVHLPMEEPILFALLLGALLAVPAVLAQADDLRTRSRARAVLAIAAAQLMLVLVVAKQPRAHYMVPGVALVGSTLALGWATVRDVIVRWRWRRALAACLAVALVAQLVVHVVGIVRSLDANRRRSREAETIAVTDDARLVRGMLVAAPAAALRHGDHYTGGRYAGDLRRLYPRFLIWDGDGLHHFGQPVALRDLLDEATGGYSFRCFVNTGYPGTPLGGGHWRRERIASFGPHALERVWLPFVEAKAPEAFDGFVDARGLRSLEGPYPELGLPTPVRWGLRPSTELTFLSPGGEIALVLEGQGYGPVPSPVGVFLEGRPLGRLEFPTSPAFGRRSLRVSAPPGLRELALAYEGPRYDDTGFGVMYRRLTLRLKRPADAPADDGRASTAPEDQP
jgi:hypothetical protein